MKRTLILILLTLFLSGCWNSLELDDTALVYGIGLSKQNDRLRMTVEIIRPGDAGGEGTATGESIILEKEADTLIEASRELIREVKRRLSWEHNRVWIINEELAKDEDFISYLDLGRRDEMFRINSYIFVTKDDPIDILSTPTLYDDLTSGEIVSALGQKRFLSGFADVRFYDLFKHLEGPLPYAYLPMIKKTEEHPQPVTTINGTAVFKDGKMIGELTDLETVGLNVLHNEAEGGYTQIDVKGGKVSLETRTSQTTIEPVLNGDELEVAIDVNIHATLADNHATEAVTEEWMNQVEEQNSLASNQFIEMLLEKLQKEYKTDITGIGMETYRKYPKEWKEVKDDWEDIFSKTEVSLDVTTTIDHEGLIDKNLDESDERPFNNPYQFWKDE
jgi:Ger(x)C family germination protein